MKRSKSFWNIIPEISKQYKTALYELEEPLVELLFIDHNSLATICRSEWNNLHRETPRRPEDSKKGNVPDAVSVQDRKHKKVRQPSVASPSTREDPKIARTSLRPNERDRDWAAADEESREGAEEKAKEDEEESEEDGEEADEFENSKQTLQDPDTEILEDSDEGKELQEMGSDSALPSYQRLEANGKYWVEFRNIFDWRCV